MILILLCSPPQFKGEADPLPPPLDVHDHVPLLSALHPQRVEPPLQPTALNPPPLTQLLVFTLQRDLPLLQTLSACDPLPPLLFLLQGRGKLPLLPSTVHTYVPLLSDFFL